MEKMNLLFFLLALAAGTSFFVEAYVSSQNKERYLEMKPSHRSLTGKKNADAELEFTALAQALHRELRITDLAKERDFTQAKDSSTGSKVEKRLYTSSNTTLNDINARKEQTANSVGKRENLMQDKRAYLKAKEFLKELVYGIEFEEGESRLAENSEIAKQQQSDLALPLYKSARSGFYAKFTPHVPCGWSDWSDWTECNTGCGTGLRERYRTCLCQYRRCDGESTEWEECPGDGCLPEADNGCGTRVIERAVHRIVGGETAARGAWPWQAQLFLFGKYFKCGGTLVGPRHVISAAHCFEGKVYGDARSWKIHLGKQDLTESIGNGETISDVKKLIIHEKYDSDTSENDIAMMILAERQTPSKKINFACLNVDNNKLFDSSSDCFITGWGNTAMEGDVASQLQEANVPLIKRSTCNQRNSYDGRVTDEMLCAGFLSGGVDSCQGDSGGPLVCSAGDSNRDQERWYLVGVTSWGYGCATPNYPGVYTDVSKYMKWIKDLMNSS